MSKPTVQPSSAAPIDPEALRREVRHKYEEVARRPTGGHHFHTGRPLAARLGYPRDQVAALPDSAVESFAGIANPFSLRTLQPGEHVVDVGCGAGFDSILAARAVGPEGAVIGVDMTDDMLAKGRRSADTLGLNQLEFRKGFAEELPVDTAWADVVISNGVFNLCVDKRRVFAEVRRVLKPGGWLQLGDIANSKPVPPEVVRQIDLWTG